MSSSRRDRAQLADLRDALRTWRLGSGPILSTSFLDDLRRAVDADTVLAYGVELDEQHLKTSFAHHSGYCRSVFRPTFDEFLLDVPPVGWTFFNPLRPERRQQNAVLSVDAIERMVGKSAEDAPVQIILRRLGLGGMDQLRVLVCDGDDLLSAICLYRERGFSPAERTKLQTLTSDLLERLRHERDFEDVAVFRRSRDLFLDAIARPAFMLNARGGVVAENAAGRALLERHGRRHFEGTLRDAARGRTTPRIRARALTGDTGVSRMVLVTVDPEVPWDLAGVGRVADRWTLTRREREVLELLVQGKANKAIAVELRCAPATVEVHVSRILAKAGVDSRAELMVAVWRAGR